MSNRNALLDDLPFDDDLDSGFEDAGDFNLDSMSLDNDFNSKLTGGAADAPDGGALEA